MFKSFIRKRKAAQAAKAYKAGYDHAAGEILAAGKNFEGLIVLCSSTWTVPSTPANTTSSTGVCVWPAATSLS